MSRRYTVLATLFCVCLIVSNIFESKIFTLGPLQLTGGFLVFPLSYIINDILTEVYGYKKCRFVIVMSFSINILFLCLFQIEKILPGAPYWDGQAHFDYLFNASVKVTGASMLAFLCGALLNARSMSWMKRLSGGKGFGWRAVVSSLIGETADSLVFFPIAFFGIGFGNILTLMLTQILLKTAYEIIVLPFTAWYVRHLTSARLK